MYGLGCCLSLIKVSAMWMVLSPLNGKHPFEQGGSMQDACLSYSMLNVELHTSSRKILLA